LVEGVEGDVEGRHEVDDIAQGPQQGAFFQGAAVDGVALALLPGEGDFALLAGHQFDGGDQAAAAELADPGMLTEALAPGVEEGGARRQIGQNRLFGEDLLHLHGQGAGQGVAGVGVGVEKGPQGGVVVVEGLVDVLRGQNRGQGQIAAGDALGQAQQIGADAGVFVGEQLAGAAEADGDLVGDVVHLPGVAQLPQLAQIDGRIDAHAGGALDQGFDDDGGDLPVALGHQPLQVLEAGGVAAVAAEAVGAAETVRPLGLEGVEEHGPVDVAIQIAAAHGQGADGLAVVGLREGDEADLVGSAALLPVLEAHFQGHFHRRRTVVGQKHPIQVARRQGHQPLRQFRRRLVGEAGEDVVGDALRLLLQGAVEARMVVAEQVDPPGGDAVDVAPAVHVDEPGALAAGDGDGRLQLMVLLLGAGMPQMAPIDVENLVFGHGVSLRLKAEQRQAED